MATKTISASKDAGARHTVGGTGSGTWNGHEEHLICGLIGSRQYRSFVRFNVAWKSWNVRTLTSATLKLYRDKDHSTATTSSTLRVVNMAKDWGETVYGSEGNWSSAPNYNWDTRATVGARRTSLIVSESVGTPNGNQYVEDTIDVTDLVMKWAPTNIVDTDGNTGRGLPNYGFILYNSDESTANKCLEFCSRDTPDGASYYPQLTLIYDESSAPAAPTNLRPTGGQGVQGIPVFKGSLSDANEYDELSAVRVQVFHDSSGTNLKWDSGIVGQTGSDFWVKAGVSDWKIGKTFYWKAKTRDNSGLMGPFSALQSFVPTTLPPVPTGLQPEAGIIPNGAVVFSGVSKDQDVGGYIEYAQVNIYTDEAQSTVHWASGDVATGTTGSAFSVTYAGSGLTSGNTYYWKMRAKDDHGGYSPWSQLRKMIVPDTGAVSGLNYGKFDTLTPTLTATAPATQNAFQIIVTTANGTEHSDTGTVAASGTAISHLYAGSALSWGTKYYWKVRSRNTSNVWTEYSTPAPIFTNTSPAAQPVSPAAGSIVVVPELRVRYADADIANGFDDPPTELLVDIDTMAPATMQDIIVDGATSMHDDVMSVFPGYYLEDFEWHPWARYGGTNYAAYSVDTVIYNQGTGSLKCAVSAQSGTSLPLLYIFPGGDVHGQRYSWDFSLGDDGHADLRTDVRVSTLSNLTRICARLYDNAGNWEEWDITPASAGAFESTVFNRNTTPYATSGTLDWSDIDYLVYNYTTSGSYTGDIHLDAIRIHDSTFGTVLEYETDYQWAATFTDSSGAANEQGSESAFNQFRIGRNPICTSLAIDAADLTGGDIDNPTPTISVDDSSAYLSGGRTQAHTQLVIYEDDSNGEVVYDTGKVVNTSTSVTVPEGYLQNGKTYLFWYTRWDSGGLSAGRGVTYDVSFTPPADLTPVTTTGDEYTGTVVVEWPKSALSASDFNRYELLRYDGTAWSIVAQITDQDVTEFYDYSAGYDVTYTYRLLQYENHAGSNPVPSLGADQPEVQVSIDDWSIVVPDRDDLLIVLYMRKDKHQPKVQEEVFSPWGRKSKVFQRSGVMGNEGTLTFIVPSDEADEFKYKMEQIIDLGIPVYIKTPFGDSWKSYIKPPSISYRNGGHIDGTITFTEVN